MSKLYTALAALLFIGIVAGVSGYKGFQMGEDSVQARWDKAELDRKAAQDNANEKILKERPKVKHENQNRDHVELVRHGCERGWVRDFENCPADSRKNGNRLLRNDGHDRHDPAGEYQ